MGFFAKIIRWFSSAPAQKIDDHSPKATQGKRKPERNGKRSFPSNDDTASCQQKRTERESQLHTKKSRSNPNSEKSASKGKSSPSRPAFEAQPLKERPLRADRPAVSMEGWVAPAGVRQSPEEVLFQDLPIAPPILRALVEDMQFRACSPIQAQALPHVLKGEDLEGKAQTGTGKTATFLIGVLQKYLEDKAAGTDDREPWQPMAFVLAPTRELAIQIAKDADDIANYCREFSIVAVYGGMDYDKQLSDLSHGVDLVVATPGRLIDYLHKHAVDLSRVKVAVIDEADRMLDMGFIPDVKRIFSYLGKPELRQTMLFSATLTHDIEMLARIWMRPSPAHIEIEPEHILAEGIDETIYSATTAEKMPILLWTLSHEDCRRVLIFRNRKRDVEALAELLRQCGVECEMLSGDVEQKRRLRILEEFRQGTVRIIVATDVAGRGIHVDDVTHVINYDFPYEAEDYVHRVGRTARAGHKGRAISFADEDSAFVIPDIEQYIERQLPITQPSEEMLQIPEKCRDILKRKSHDSHNGSMKNHPTFRGGGYRTSYRSPSGSRHRGA